MKNSWNGRHGNWTPPSVGGIDHHTRCPEIGLEDPDLLQGTICQDESSRRPVIHCTPCTKVHLKVQVSTRWIAMPGHEDETPSDDPSICKGTTVLGRENQSASVW